MAAYGINGPDFAGRGPTALGTLFDGMVAEIQHKFESEKPAASSPELPEPMLGAMGRLGDGA